MGRAPTSIRHPWINVVWHSGVSHPPLRSTLRSNTNTSPHFSNVQLYKGQYVRPTPPGQLPQLAYPYNKNKEMKFTSTFAALATLVATVLAVHSADAAVADVLAVGFSGPALDVSARALEARSGCGSICPLGEEHYICYCQAMDASGCYPGTVSHIAMEVDDPNDTIQYAKGYNTNSLEFTCPSAGTVRCEANFNDNDDEPNYSLRVVSA
ncbi:hypothetical protein GLOTRDRAFT_133458 [Gloeophyllum trabeum ATCC 11539]|uniref:Uncharacterized protein n=1 Tax=Gloeophyllum trabeum (strain ATCC 11539 / FP-39264 / Madison 617) TaxID=670483 RepID=S7RA52_GLOTA|nr:uncharacterized protein GLOTRDRAFT_133458 [Gloeophyllum trabeum ATCC 11539]EPQ51140.1 hypothetical protein GLOTRDRAFT_133458 [Gloeophyllum trabeum ATCC 11539]